jgi:Alpha/beta hydrolase domain
VKFPHVPGIEFPAWMPRIWRLDFGPDYAIKGVIDREPPALGEQFTVLVPVVKPDGNDIGGIELPEIAAPLGTFTGWNYALPVLPNLDYLAGLFGSFIPFARTAEERKSSGDQRLSIQERYPSKEAYMKQITQTAKGLVARRLMRAEDVSAALAQAATQWNYLTGQ